MAYTEEGHVGVFQPVNTTVIGERDLSAAVAVHGEYVCMRRCRVKRLLAYVTLPVVATTTAPIVTFQKRTSYGTSSGQVSLGTLTLPNGATLGQVYYKDIVPFGMKVGDTLCLNHTTQAVGTAAGKIIFGFEVELDPETVANESNMVASA